MYEIFASIGKYKQEKDQEKDQERNWQVVHSTTIFAFFHFFIFLSFFLQSLAFFLWNGLHLYWLKKQKALNSLYSVLWLFKKLWHRIEMLQCPWPKPSVSH